MLRNLEEAKITNKHPKVIERLRGHIISETNVRSVAYRPFDNRSIYYESGIIERARERVISHLFSDNIGLAFNRSVEQNRDFADIFVFDQPIQLHSLSIKEVNYIAPLYVFSDDGKCSPNFNSNSLRALTLNLNAPFQPEGILDYIYAVLHSPSYRQKYQEFLKADFPRIPIPQNNSEFTRLAELGKQLRELHLVQAPQINDYATTYPVIGDDSIDRVEFVPESSNATVGKIYINQTQYFGNVPKVAWDFYTGGYQPAQKWLKDRKGRRLSSDDIVYYQRIIKILLETGRIMREIDERRKG